MRWKPTRAGVFNIWEYDDQTFEFGDGRLALRGRNGSGKSNALALLFPFVLDGVMSAARMDPMGGGRSMKSLLLGRDDDDRTGRFRHESGTGYVWMEFGDGTAFVTIGIGASATQHRDADPWLFVTGQRIGHDLELADNETPLGRRQLEERLTDGAVFTTAEEYRTAVDRRLLGLGAARYRRLVDLLLTLRRPHLAGKLDTEHLSATLSAGLGELDQGLVDDVAHSFDDLDAMQHELEGLAASLGAVERFLPVYRDHLVGVGRGRAQAVADGHTGVRAVDRDRATTESDRNTARSTKADLAAQSDAAAIERRRLDGEIDNIQQSPAYQNATALGEVKRAAEKAAADSQEATERAEASETDARVAGGDLSAAQGRVDSGNQAVVTAIDEWIGSARIAGVEVPPTAADFDDARAIAGATERRDQVGQVGGLIAAAAAAVAEARRAEDAERRAGERAAASVAHLDDAARETQRRRDDLAERRNVWTRAVGALVDRLGVLVPDAALDPSTDLWAPVPIGGPSRGPDDIPDPDGSVDGTDVADGLSLDRAATLDIDLFHAVDRRMGGLDTVAVRGIDGAEAALAAQTEVVGDLTAERERVATEPNPGPPPNPTRPDAQRDDRLGAPLYVCVDFADHVEASARAGLEAALGAAGLLDAWVQPANTAEPSGVPAVTDVLDASLIGLAGPSVAGATLAEVLVPVPVAGLDADRITAVLGSIPVAGDVVELHTDGRWRLGPVAGRFAQPEQQFIGHAARERRRAERLAVLDEAIAAAGEILDSLRDRRHRLVTVHAELAAARADQPSTGELVKAVAALRRSIDVADARASEHVEAVAHAAACLRQAESTSSELHRTAIRLRLPADAAALADVDTAFRECDANRKQIGSARAALDVALHAHANAAAAAGRADERRARDRAAATVAEEAARDEEQRYRQLSDNVGGDAQRAVEALADARRRRREVDEVVAGLVDRLAESSADVVRLTERIDHLAARHAELSAALMTAERSFAVVCSAEIADVLVVEGVEPGSDPRAAARRLLAGTDAVADDATNRMEKAHREILLDGLRAGHDPSMPKVDGVDVVRVGTVDGEVPIGTLARQLRDEYERTGQLLTKQEREIFETHLLTRVGDALRQLLLDADAFEHHINAEMAKVPTESGMIVELAWEVAGDEPGLREAIKSLRTAPEMLGPERREALREFFMQRIADLRSSDPGRSFAETLTATLDYRSWHQFAVYARFVNGRRQRVTRAFYRGLSGGEAATLLHLPLFAAAASQYSNGAIAGPRLIALDEAFVGIDDKMRSRLMGLLTQLDLDVILTSHEFWGFYDTVPSLVLYDLVRRPPTPGVYAQRLDWTADPSEPPG